VPIHPLSRQLSVRKCWVLLLGYLLDLKDSAIITQVCAPFAWVCTGNLMILVYLGFFLRC
jgi:hypothetical protein